MRMAHGLLGILLMSYLAESATTNTIYYRYDDLGRVEGVEHGGVSTTEYRYDPADNRTLKKVTIAPDTISPVLTGIIVFSNVTASSFVAVWPKATDDKVVAAYEYNIGSGWFSNGEAQGKSFTGLVPSTQYTVQVRAKDAAGNTSSPVISGSQLTLPDTIPPILIDTPKIAQLSSTYAFLNWTAATDNVAVAGYEYRLNSGSWLSVGVNALSLSGLTPSTTYNLYIRAVDTAGNKSAESSPAIFSTLSDISPTAPGQPIFSNITYTGATATWAAATDDVAVASYEYAFNQAIGSWTNIGNSLSTNLSGLVAGQSYTLYVRAVDSAGNKSIATAASLNTKVDTVAPTAPTTLDVTQVSSTSVHLAWSGASDDLAITGYMVRYLDGATPSQWASLSAASFDFTGLTSGKTYTFEVKAYDAAGNQGSAISKAKALLDLDKPTQPAIISKSQLSSSTLRVSWNASTDNIGISGYRYRTYDGSTYSAWSSLQSATAADIGSLTVGKTYVVYVRAEDAAGNLSDESNISHLMLDIDKPSVPGTPSKSQVNSSILRVNWGVATDNIGVSGYSYRTYDGSAYSSWSALQSSTTADISGLVVGKTYTVYIRAQDAAGNIGDEANASHTMLDIDKPSLPSITSKTQLNSNTLRVSWSAATDNVAVSGYRYRTYDGSSYSAWSALQSATSVDIGGMVVGNTYTVYVRAEDAAGNVSSESSTTHTMLDITKPSAAGAVSKSQLTSTTLRVSWGAATDNVSVSGYSYRIYDGSSYSSWSALQSSTSVDISGLTVGKTYTVYIRAQDAAGNISDEVNTSHAMLDIVNPTAPSGLVANQTSSSTLTVSWNPSTDDIQVRGYRYRVNAGGWSAEQTGTTISLSGLVVGATYTIYVQSVDTSGNYSAESSVPRTISDMTSPVLTGSITVSSVTTTSATVTWPAATDDGGILRYQYRVDGGNWISNSTSRAATVNGGQNTRHTFEVLAVDNSSNMSQSISGVVKMLSYPPQSVYVDGITMTSAVAHWSAPTDSNYTSGYQYSLDGSNWTTVSSSTFAATLTGLTAGQSYTFRVRTLDTEGQVSAAATSGFSASSPPPTVSISGMSINKSVSGAATYQLASSGVIYVSVATSAGTSSAGYWLSPQTGMSGFEVRATNKGYVSTCLNQTNIGSWINLGNSPIWTQPGYSVTMTCTLLIEIRSVSNPGTILSSATVMLTGKQ